MIAPDVAAAAAAGRVPKGLSLEYLSQDHTRQYAISIICITVVTFVVVSLRITSRLFILRSFGLDDSLAIASLILMVPFAALCILLMAHGSGRHYAYLLYVAPRSDIRLIQTLDFSAGIVYVACLLLCRLSGLAFYHRVVDVYPTFLHAIRGFAALFAACFLAQLCLIVFHCWPVTSLFPYRWETDHGEYACMDWGVLHAVVSALSLLCDVLLFGIPVAILSILKMSRKRKVQLAGILMPGVLVIGSSVARLVFIVDCHWLHHDHSWKYDPLLITEVCEMGGTLVALSVPGLKPMWDRRRQWKDIVVSLGGASDIESGGGGGGAMRRQSSAGVGPGQLAVPPKPHRLRDGTGFSNMAQLGVESRMPKTETTSSDGSRGSKDAILAPESEKG